MNRFTKVLTALCLTGLVSGLTQAADIPKGTVLAEKQELNYNYVSSPDTIDPTLSQYSNSFSVNRMLFDTLVRQNSHGDYVGQAAKSWEVSEDGLTWTFHLREDAKWSDGQPVKAKDFVYSWQRLTDPKTAAAYGDYLVTANVANAKEVFEGKAPVTELGVSAPDDYTLVVKLTQPTPWLSQMVTLGVLSPLRQDVLEKFGDNWTGVDNIVTNGPFLLKVNRLNDTMDFERNPNHWDAANTVITKVHFDFIQNPLTGYYKYLTGEYPTTGIPTQFKKKVLEERPEELITIQTLSTSYFKVNNKRVTDPRVRKAIALLVNRNVLTEKILGGHKPTSQFTPPLIKDGQYVKQAYWLNRPHEENVAEAIELLKEAGYTKEKPYELTYLMMSGSLENKIYVALAGMIKQGSGGLIDFKQEVLESKAWVQRVSGERDYDITTSGWNADYDQASTFFNLFSCNSSINDILYCNPEYDRVLDEANRTQDAEKRAQLYAQLNDIIVGQDYAVIPLYNTDVLALKSPALQGYNEKNDVRYFNDYYFVAGKKVKGAK
ncbi:ABC transporter substrate-binding protein [Psittacicella hinzii]|nr:peptide ABC transporter substrate-binding protein [Psittacicella hinzii]